MDFVGKRYENHSYVENTFAMAVIFKASTCACFPQPVLLISLFADAPVCRCELRVCDTCFVYRAVSIVVQTICKDIHVCAHVFIWVFGHFPWTIPPDISPRMNRSI